MKERRELAVGKTREEAQVDLANWRKGVVIA